MWNIVVWWQSFVAWDVVWWQSFVVWDVVVWWPCYVTISWLFLCVKLLLSPSVENCKRPQSYWHQVSLHDVKRDQVWRRKFKCRAKVSQYMRLCFQQSFLLRWDEGYRDFHFSFIYLFQHIQASLFIPLSTPRYYKAINKLLSSRWDLKKKISWKNVKIMAIMATTNCFIIVETWNTD